MKVIIIGLTVVGLMYLPFVVPLSKSQSEQTAGALREEQSAQAVDKSKEQYYQSLRLELYQDVLITALDGVVLKALNDYYGRPVSYELHEAKIIDAIRPNGYRTFNFLVKVEVRPCIKPHTAIGIDVVTIKVSSGKVGLYKFKHIKSFDLPPQLNEPKRIL